MKIAIDVVIGHTTLTLEQLKQLHKGQVKPLTDFVQSSVMLKSGNELIATGTLIKVDESYGVLVDEVNPHSD
ncbi:MULTISPECIES: FliM/FliN family flagellar motor switch protein [Vibrio harveyi group]|uniref:Type III secretion protein n=1 Tax=Vibrio harveyi TaxID=669 RepID=A0ABN4KT92_VIBHA|nr:MULTISPECIES: FliM/FliN family flagellar motor C-terminal domain-containing protein [Vibrio harveyi group]AMF96294.1 type III secretion protein [Vibrio harveyi]EKO3870277.1 FliM/FliN family flagellar motor switch protein [Vibrio harveyi]ELC3158212.1 FliM/FliN family flagellar motor switch protein [Vibrio harveyi]MDF5599664.1 FliM/FliN family flagellar motor C-terminal domain-containing protein [Vibrio parahaemolyticus]MEA5385433.1 FliM/FliN family flagellar motor C-terminal domain-containin